MSLLLVVLIIILCISQKGFYYAVGVVPTIVYGLSVAAGSSPGESLWVSGVAVTVIGCVFLVKFIMWGIEAKKNKI